MVSRGVLPIGRNSGGAELVAYELARGLAARGDEVVLVSDVDASAVEATRGLTIAPVQVPSLVRGLIRVVPLRFLRWLAQHLAGNVLAARRASAALRDGGTSFDVVHCHGALAAILLARLARTGELTVPLLYTEHDSSPWSCAPRGHVEGLVRRAIYRTINLRAAAAASAVLTNFDALADELSSRIGLPRAHFAVLPNGVSDETRPQHDAAAATTAHYCLFVGALVERKGPDRLLHALEALRLNCVFVGDGPLRGELEHHVARSGMTSRVTFTGAIEPRAVRRYYEHADALVLPSASEGVPLVAVEALSAGVPVIASRLQGISSVVHDGVNGLLVEPGDTDALVAALAAVEERGALYSSLRHEAAARATTIPGWRNVSERLSDVYERECVHRTWRDGAAGSDGATLGRTPLPAASALGLPRAMVELWALGGVGA